MVAQGTTLLTITPIRLCDEGILPQRSRVIFRKALTSGISDRMMYEVQCPDGHIRLIYPEEVMYCDDQN